MSVVEDEPTWDSKNILGQAQRAKMGERASREHPMRGPGEQIMGHISEQDQSLLGIEVLFAALLKTEATLIRLNLGFTHAAVIIMGDDFRHRPVKERTEQGAIFQPSLFGEPA